MIEELIDVNLEQTRMLVNLMSNKLLSVDNIEIYMVPTYLYLGDEVKIDKDDQTEELSRRIMF